MKSWNHCLNQTHTNGVDSNNLVSKSMIGGNGTNWKLRRRRPLSSFPIFHNFSVINSILCSVLIVIGISIQNGGATQRGSNFDSHILTKRAAIQSSQSEVLVSPSSLDLTPLFPRSENPLSSFGENGIESENVYNSIPYHDTGIRFPEPTELTRGQRNLNLEMKEEGRKASPDVQDIIDGIVKLLGGKVHNQNANKNNRQQFIQNQKHPHFPPPHLQNQHPQMPPPPPTDSQFHVLQSHSQPPQIPLNRPYNLFNPTKPIFYLTPSTTTTTAKPARINNRGPPIPTPTDKQQEQFEAIPLEVLHNHHDNPNVSIGPPFPLSQVAQGHHHQVNEAPYKLGVPLPQQLVPHPQPVEQQRPSNDLHHYHYRPQQESDPNPMKRPNDFGTRPLLVPVDSVNQLTPRPGGSHLSGPIQAQLHTDSIEDDEKDAERLLNGNKPIPPNGLKTPFGSAENLGGHASVSIEPTITEGTQLPTFVLESSRPVVPVTVTEEVSRLSTIGSATRSYVNLINPTTASGYELPMGSSTGGPDFRHPDPIPSSVTVSKGPVFNNGKKNIGIGTSTNLGSLPTPSLLRPGTVLDDKPNNIAGGGQSGGFGSVQVVPAIDNQHPHYGNHGEEIGQVFDVTVTAQQNYGGQATIPPFNMPVHHHEEIITSPNGNEQFVSIDGKRTYFNLHSTTASTSPVGVASIPSHFIPPTSSTNPPMKSHPGVVGVPTHPFANPPGGTNKNRASATLAVTSTANKSVGTSLKINNPGEDTNPIGGSKSPPNIIRRPITRRPPVPPVRIDTCILGDDSTCNGEQFESCRTENGVSSCMCRAGYARKRHREPCKAILSLVLSIRMDKLGEKKLNYNPDYFNPNSEIYQNLEWETIHGLDSIFGESQVNGGIGYIGSKLDAIGFDGRHAVVNSTVLIQELPNVPTNQVKREIQRQLIDSITRHHNGFGKSELTVEGPISAINVIADLNECEHLEMNDCDAKAKCVNTYGSFECHCESGYGDKLEKDKRRSGRKCESCSAKVHCNGRGDCLIENGQNTCRCAGNYYGSQCDIDGEVLAVAISASVSAFLIIGLTLACLCVWSRRWKREEQKAALMSRTLFGGVASQAMSYLGKNTMTPYQQHLTLDERLRWAQVDPSLPSGNIYVQNEPLSYGPMETPQMMASARRSAETCDTSIDDLFDENRHHFGKRPKSRSSQLHYCDLEGEPQSDIYASRGPPFFPPFPAQFCVHSRGFYN